MARVDSRTLFLTTSPRTPAKMIPEIKLLNEHFEGEKWKKETSEFLDDIEKGTKTYEQFDKWLDKNK